METRFGHPDEWGLSPQRHSEIASELSDHLDCLKADEGQEAAREAEQRLAEPKARRRLTAAHIADQVVATLHRWPSRSEWRELGWLLFWFAVVLLGDWLAGRCDVIADAYRAERFQAWAKPAGFSWMAISAWLLLGISRAMFFYVLYRGVMDAWQRGWGVLIARLLQYKLIHTLILFTGILLLEDFLSSQWHWSLSGRLDGIAPWFTVAVGCFLLLAGLIGVLLPKLRSSPVPAIALLLLIFLYPTGPASMHRSHVLQPWPVKTIGEDSKYRYLAVSTDEEHINKVIENSRRINGSLPPGWSRDNMILEHWEWQLTGPWMNAAMTRRGHTYGRDPAEDYKQTKIVGETRSNEPVFATLPMIGAGSGLSWVAAPVPLMGILGLLAMLFIMGRRGILPMFLYSAITGLALYCSVVPFVLTQKYENVFEFSLLALVYGPFPGFEQILSFRYDMDGYWIMGALLLSAGIPWLLTGLFLRPGSASQQTADGNPDMETT